MYYVYILKCINGKHYTGMTKDINRRMKEHMRGRSISTRYNRPLRLTFLTTLNNKSLARKLEVRIKNIGATKFLIQNKLEGLHMDLAKHPNILRSIVNFNFKVRLWKHDLIIHLLPT